jgi:hypothetical protein
VEEPPFGGSSVLKRQIFNRRHGKPNVRATMPDEQQRRCGDPEERILVAGTGFEPVTFRL